MADKWPLANGNWSNAANWNGGTKPVAGDDVYADNRTVTVDEDFSVATIRNTARSGGTAGGSFSFSGTRNCTCNIITGATTCATFSGSLTINGNVTGGTSLPSVGISATNAGTTLVVNGTLTGGAGSLSGTSAASAIQIALGAGPPCIVVINGSVNGGVGSGGYGIYCQGTAGANPDVTITGNVLSGSGQAAIRIDKGSMVINGNITGASNVAALVSPGGFATLVVNGNLVGGAGTNSRGILFDAAITGSITVNGNAIGGSGSSCNGLTITSPSANVPISVMEAIASTTSNGISNSSSSVIQVKKLTSASNGLQAVAGPFRFTNDADISMYHWRGDTTFITLTDVTQVAGLLPTVGNVRQGMTYNAGGLTGTLAVPNPNQVAVGVATDNTVGTAAITAATIRSALGLASANLDTQLSNKPTLAQIEASSVLAKEATVSSKASQTSVDGKPTLAQIEASSVLAKSEQITSLQNNAPAEAF